MSIPPSLEITREEEQYLEQINLFKGGKRPGKRSASTSLLSPPTTDESSNSSTSVSPATVQTIGFDSLSGSRFFDLPTSSHSPAALEFIGFTSPTATEIFTRWSERPDPEINPDDLIDYAYGHIEILNSVTFRNLTAEEALTRIGIAQDTQDALTDPYFDDLFWSQTIHYWVRDTLRVNYSTLLQLQQRAKNVVERGKGKKKRKRGSIQGVFPSSAQQQAQPSETVATVELMTPKDHNLPAAHISLAAAGPILEDHVVLYRGQAATQYVHSSLIKNDGSVNMDVIGSQAGGDFNNRSIAWYWSPEKEVGEHYRQWAARRSSNCASWLIRIQVPKALLGALRSHEIWYGEEWEEFVWYCRHMLRNLPTKFDWFMSDGGGLDVIKGHICGKPSRLIKYGIEEENVQRDLTRESVLLVPGSNRQATQVVLMTGRAADLVEQSVRGKLHINMFKALQDGTEVK